MISEFTSGKSKKTEQFSMNYLTKALIIFVSTSLTVEQMVAWLTKFYNPAHQRIASWVIGIMLGFVMYETRGRKVKIHRALDSFLWVLSIGTVTGIVMGLYPFQQMVDNQTTNLGNALYNTCFRILWCYAVGWMIFACHNGTGGIIRWFLSLKEWQPLGKLGLSIYLVHHWYQIVTNINERQPIYWSFFTRIQKFYGDILVSIFLATILYLAVENPVLSIENYLHKLIQGLKK